SKPWDSTATAPTGRRHLTRRPEFPSRPRARATQAAADTAKRDRAGGARLAPHMPAVRPALAQRRPPAALQTEYWLLPESEKNRRAARGEILPWAELLAAQPKATARIF